MKIQKLQILAIFLVVNSICNVVSMIACDKVTKSPSNETCSTRFFEKCRKGKLGTALGLIDRLPEAKRSAVLFHKNAQNELAIDFVLDCKIKEQQDNVKELVKLYIYHADQPHGYFEDKPKDSYGFVSHYLWQRLVWADRGNVELVKMAVDVAEKRTQEGFHFADLLYGNPVQHLLFSYSGDHKRDQLDEAITFAQFGVANYLLTYVKNNISAERAKEWAASALQKAESYHCDTQEKRDLLLSFINE